MAKGATQKISGLYDLLIFSSVLLGMAGMGMVYTSSFIQGIPCPLAALAIMFLVPFAVYNMNRKTDKEEDAINRQDRFTFTKRFEMPLFFLALAAYAAAYALAVPFGIQALIVVSIPLLCGILYSVRWIPPPLPFRRFKEIPVVKNIMVAFAWSSISALLPVCLAGGTPGMKTWICFLFFFAYVIVSSTVPDIRDRDGDALSGIKTVPVLIGAENTRRLLLGVQVLFGILVVSEASRTIPLLPLLVLAAGFAYSLSCIHIFERVEKRDLVCDFLIDGQYVLFGTGIFFLSALRILP